MRKLTILVDMDDTVEGLLSAWLYALNKDFGTDIGYDDIDGWNITKFFPTLTPEQVYSPLYSESFWKHVKPLEGAAENLERIIRDGHDVYIVTASAYETLKSKMDNVLFRYFPFIKWDHVIVTSNKQLVRGDIMIDDGVHNLIGGKYKKILMTAPHNKDYDAEANGMTRVTNWNEVYELVSREANTDTEE